jgi:L-arabinose isomerase
LHGQGRPWSRHRTDGARSLRPRPDFAEIAGIELVTIDSSTDGRSFRNELRWNQAYHHLAGGV